MAFSGILGLFGLPHLVLAYFIINIDPIAFYIGSIAVHWYGLMYVVAIGVALWVLLRYVVRQGLYEEQLWGVFIWVVIAGLVGGRLYFVVQQPDLVQGYLLQPQKIIAVWNGGMAFYGAIFLGTLTLFIIAPRYGIDRFFAIDCGALFAAVGQIFGRVGNVINGDILGQAVSNGPVNIPAQTCSHAPCIAYVPDTHIQPPWAIVYLNAHSFATTGIAYQPAQVYEMLFNLAVLAILWPLRYRLPRIKAGYFFALYLALYGASQFLVFFTRGTEPTTPFLGIDVLKQAQWTALAGILLAGLIFWAARRYSLPWTHDAAHPVDWDAPAPETLPHIPGLTMSEARRRLNHDQKQVASANNVNGTVQAVPLKELPTWEPTHPPAGSLRNVFSPGDGEQDA